MLPLEITHAFQVKYHCSTLNIDLYVKDNKRPIRMVYVPYPNLLSFNILLLPFPHLCTVTYEKHCHTFKNISDCAGDSWQILSHICRVRQFCVLKILILFYHTSLTKIRKNNKLMKRFIL